ncbi:MAG: PAS domain-containing protein, partial [Fimbriiglobus sp.]
AVEPVTVGIDSFFESTPAELADQFTERRLLLEGEDEAGFYASLSAAIAARRPWEREFRFRGVRTGRVRWARVQAHPVPDPAGGPGSTWSVLAVDTTAGRRAEADVRRAFQRLSAHLENTPVAVVEWDAEMRVVRWSPRAEDVFGWTADDVLGKHFSDWRFVHDADAPRIAGAVSGLLSRADVHAVFRSRHHHKSGQVLEIEWHNSVLTDDRGQVVSVLSLVLDRTAETTAATAAARSEERLKTALRFAGMLGWDLDWESRSAYYSDDYYEFYGVPGSFPGAEGNLTGLSDHFHVIHPEDRMSAGAAVAAAMEAGADLQIEFRGAAPAADGGDRWFTSRGQIVRGPDGRPTRILGVTADVTTRKLEEFRRAALTAELEEARRLESLAVLAGGVAHDLNNALTVILGNAGVLRATPGLAAAGAGPLAEIENACQRAADLCQQITAYAGTGRVRSERIELNLAVRAAAGAIAAAACPQASITYDFADPSPATVADAHQFRQVLLNLVRNAADSGDSVHVRVSTGVTTLPDPDPTARWSPKPAAGAYAVLEVADDGRGMDAATLENLFRPFAELPGCGRGLGLSAVHGIARSHRGAVSVVSVPGRGTTVRVALPLAEPVRPPADLPAPGSAAAGGFALVVDDEPNIRELAAVMLEELGYTVEAAADGPGALATFHRNPTQFRVAVVDLMLPGKSGGEVIAEIRHARADLPIVVMTGYTANELPPELAQDPRVTLLMKPFRLDQFQATVRAAAGRPADAPRTGG